MRKTRRLLSLVVSIAMVVSMFTFVVPVSAAVGVTKAYDGTGLFSIAKTDQYPVTRTSGHGGIGGKAADDLSGYVEVEAGTVLTTGGGCFAESPWYPSISSITNNRTMIAIDVFFTRSDAYLTFEFQAIASEGAEKTTSYGAPVHIGAAFGIKKGHNTLPTVPDNAPTSLSLNEWHNIAVEAANDGTTALNVYIDGVKYECELSGPAYGTYRMRMNVVSGSFYVDNYYCYEDVAGTDMYAEEDFVMSDITVAQSDKFTYDETEKQFTITDETLTVAELKEAISTDYAVGVYTNVLCNEALSDTDTVNVNSVIAVSNGKAYRYFDFYRENTSDFEYLVNGDGTSCSVTGFKEDCVPEEGSALVIPDTIAGYTVTEIGANAFRVGTGYSGVKLSSITMPDTVEIIGANAFYDTYAAVSKWPEALKNIGNTAFIHGGRISGNLPAGLKSIGSYAFQYASMMNPVLPGGLEKIGSGAFCWIADAGNLVIPDSVTELGDKVVALTGSSLKSIRFPRNDKITAIPENTFSVESYNTTATKLYGDTAIYIPETITTIPDNLLKNFKDGATVTVFGELDSAAYTYYKKIKAALEEGTYTNDATYGEAGAYTDSDADGKGELADIKFIEYNYEADADFDSTGINKGDTAVTITTVTNDTVLTANTPGVGGKAADDVVLELDTMGGSAGQNYFYASGAEGASKSGKFYHEVSIRAPKVSYIGSQLGVYATADLKDDPDGDGVKDGYFSFSGDLFRVTPSAVYVMGNKVCEAVSGRWYTFATEVACDGSTDLAVYLNGTKYEGAFAKPAYGVRHFRVYPYAHTERFNAHYDNIRAYRSTTRNYNTLSDIPAKLTSKSDEIGIYKTGIVYADETAVYTAGELLSMLETDEFSRANIRIYSDSTYTTELADNDNVTNESMVVVAATNGFDVERTYSYYAVNPPINTTIYNISVISEADKTAKVTGFNTENLKETDDLSAISIPEEIMGYTITEIGDGAFYKNTEIQSVVLPDTVTKIGARAFGNDHTNGVANGGITSVKFPKNLKEIGDMAFQCNAGLEEISLPDGLEKIGASAFYWTRPKELTIPDSVTYIGGSAFRLCGTLKYVKLPAGVASYTNQFFANGMDIQTLIIPSTVTSIGDETFTNLNTYDMNPVVYGISGTYAEEYAEANGWQFINIIANTIVSEPGIYGDGSKELAGTDYDLKYGYENLTFKTKLVNMGNEDVEALAMLVLYDEAGMILEKSIKDVTVGAGKTVMIDETTGVSVPVTTLKDGYTAKAFVWKKSNNEPITDAVEFVFDAEKKEIHVLHIANSFGNDSFGYINSIADADGVVLKVQNMYIGGAPLTGHYKNMSQNLAKYQPVVNGVYGVAGLTMDEALRSDKWDVVALQCATHGFSKDFSFVDFATWKDDAEGTMTGTPYVTTDEMFTYIKGYVEERAPTAKKIMHMSWGPCEEQAKAMYDARFAASENARSDVFELQKAAYLHGSSIYADEYNMMVPSSYAIQYALNVLGYQEHSGEKASDNTYPNPVAGEISIFRDETCHLTTGANPYGRVLAGLTWYEYLTGNDVRENPYQNAAISEEVMAKLKEAAHWANQQVVPLTGSTAE